MNERIKEIIIETLGKEGVVDSRSFGHWAMSDEQMEKFAELIVRQCLEQIYSVTMDNPTDDWDQGYDSGLDRAAETIKTHFGVEE